MNVDLPEPGTPVMPTRCESPAWGKQAQQHLLRQLLMLAVGRLDERDGPSERGAIAGTDTVDVGVDVDGASAHS